jgi:hypothetical protein
VCDLEVIGVPSIFKTIRSAASLARMLPTLDLNSVRRTRRGGSGRIHWKVGEDELLKLTKSGQFPDEVVKIEGAQIHCVNAQTY